MMLAALASPISSLYDRLSTSSEAFFRRAAARLAPATELKEQDVSMRYPISHEEDRSAPDSPATPSSLMALYERSIKCRWLLREDRERGDKFPQPFTCNLASSH